MIQLPSCKIVGVFGPVASGKTHLIKQWAKLQDRILIFDATGEFLDDPEYTTYIKNVRGVWQHVQAQPWFFRIVYEPGRNLENDYAWILSCLWHTQSDKQLFIDEFHEICPVGSANDDVRLMLRFARHDKLGFCGVSQRIADVHKLFTSSCRMVVLFHTAEARDLVAISDRWGKEVETKVYNLRPLIYDDVTGIVSQVPQCVVIERGAAPKVFDFKTDSYTDISDRRIPEHEEEETAEIESSLPEDENKNGSEPEAEGT